MSIDKTVQNFLAQPIPLWENTATEYVVNQAWDKLKTQGISNPDEYTTARIINDSAIAIGNRIEIIKDEKGLPIYMEAPSADRLGVFYDGHGLVPDYEIETGTQLNKLKEAIDTLAQVQPVFSCVATLVRCIQVLKQDDAEIDLSYSSPKIPFTVFVSVCADDSIITNLRVAESILHEAMHLKLTLIEDITPLLLLDTGNRYFSPWRDEKRPARGVLHGLFVFKAILDFYKEIRPIYTQNDEVISYLDFRIKSIRSEINSLADFPSNPDLTEYGEMIAFNIVRPSLLSI
ncbi:MAG: HEXXH motif-containing putative peptide modification protein [Bacteroidota bacterium]